MKLDTDYLVVGSGAMGMAFTDTLLTETDATIVMVDRHHQPGGHWNDAYPHVRLHQPSSFYGVNSRALGNDTIDATGWNQGLVELATNSEVVAYFDQVMQQDFLPSGRVKYFPNCHHTGAGSFQSLISKADFQVKAGRIVDATYMNVTVPSMNPPTYDLDPGVRCEPPNALPRLSGEFDEFVVVGAGKTGMDACLFLLKNGVDPDRIRWIMPRDAWLLDRANIQPLSLNGAKTSSIFAQQAIDLAEAEDIEDLFNRCEKSGSLIRLDPNVRPTMYRCATVTQLELAELRRIRAVVRLGRVKRIRADAIDLDQGTIPTNPTTLHVDCTADGLARRPVRPVFSGTHITLQSVRTCQQVFSAAFIAHVESAYREEAIKNELCTPIPHPDTEVDFLRTNLANALNATRWAQESGLTQWLKAARLDAFSQTEPATEGGDIGTSPDPRASAIELQAAQAAVQNAQRILASIQ